MSSRAGGPTHELVKGSAEFLLEREETHSVMIVAIDDCAGCKADLYLNKGRSGLESQATVSSFLTSVVLLVGVSGGLFIVVTVIIICKYCHGNGKTIKRQGFRSSSLENFSERTYCALHRYETINSDVFSDPSSCSIDGGGSLTPRKPLEFRVPELNQESEEPTETTKLSADYEQADYSHQEIIKQPTASTELYTIESAVTFKEQDETPTKVTGNTSMGTGYGSRRVSFQLSNLPRSSSSGDFKFRRYIEGDYHHLKHSKIGRSFPRQFSIGGAGSAVPGRILLDDPQFRFSSLDERLTSSSQQNHTQFTIIAHHGLSQNDPVLRSLRDLQMHSSATQLHMGGNPQQQQQQPQQQFQHPVFQPQPHSQRRHTFSKDISPRQSRDTLSLDNTNAIMIAQRNSSDKLNSPSPTYNHSGSNKSPRLLKNSPSPTFNYVWDGTKLSPSPPNARSIRESRSTSPLALPARDCVVGAGGGAAGSTDSPPSPFMPIKEFCNYGSTPSPPHKPTKTQVAVEVHQQQQHNTMETSGNSSTNSEEIHQQLQIRLDRTRSCAEHISPSRNVSICRNKGLYGTVYSNSLESANHTQRSSYSDSRKVKSYDDYKEDYDVLKITEFSKGPFHSADYEVMAELGSPTGSKVRYNDTGSLEQLHEEDVESLCGVVDYNNLPHQQHDHHRRRHEQQQNPGAELKEMLMNENEAGAEGSDGNNSGNGSVAGNRKYRALWRLRATLEEEEECSDTIRMEDMTSPDDSPDREHATTPNTTSFESNALSDPCPSDHRDSGVQFEPTIKTHNHRANLLHPNYENRRQNYRNVMNNMLQRRNQSTSVENSFDSVETDGDVSDTSRYEVTTTSFESTTDNTDSTTESQASRLKQMKADSGYKSLESQQQSSKEVPESKNGNGSSSSSSNGSTNGHAHPTADVRKEILRVSLDRKEEFGRHNTIGLCTSNLEPAIVACGPPSPREWPNGSGSVTGNGGAASSKHGCIRKSPPNASRFDRRNGKTASKKRREYSRERQIPLVDEGMIYEPETDSRSDLHSGDSFEDNNPIPNKTSLFTRFFKSHSRGHKTQYLVRDYSIDEKTNSIFNEFVRQDNPSSSSSRDHAGGGRLGVRRSPRMHRHRFQRKHTEPSFLNEERLAMRNRLAPGMRSASLGSDSSASSARRISPQDSIEEEEDELEEAAAVHTSRFSYSLDRHPPFALQGQGSIPGHRGPPTIKCQLKTLGIHDIPIIKLPEEDCHDTH